MKGTSLTPKKFGYRQSGPYTILKNSVKLTGPFHCSAVLSWQGILCDHA